MIQLKERREKNAKKENMSVEIKTKMSDQEKERKKGTGKKDGRNKNVNDFE